MHASMQDYCDGVQGIALTASLVFAKCVSATEADDSPFNANIGVMYVQNAAPNGLVGVSGMRFTLFVHVACFWLLNRPQHGRVAFAKLHLSLLQVSWVFAEAIDRQLRWTESENWLLHKNDTPIAEYHHVVW